MAHGRGEAQQRMEMKRKFDEEPRDCDRGNTGVPEAPVPSCSHARHVPTDTTQPLDKVNCSLETFKRARMEATRKDDNFKWGNNETAENTQPVHREHDIPFNHGVGSKLPKEIHVPNTQASTGGASAGGATAGGVVDFGFQLQIDDKGSLSLNLTKEFVQGVFQGSETSIALKVESRESGGNGKCFLLTCDGIKDYV